MLNRINIKQLNIKNINKMKQDLESTQDCGDRKATRLESCKYSLLDIYKRINYINLQHYRLLNKLDVDFGDDDVTKPNEGGGEKSSGLLKDIESIINDITNKVNVLERDFNELKQII